MAVASRLLAAARIHSRTIIRSTCLRVAALCGMKILLASSPAPGAVTLVSRRPLSFAAADGAPTAPPSKKSLRVAVNARLLHNPSLRGWDRYTVNLLRELPALGVELFLYSDRPLHESHLGRLPTGSFQVRVAPPMRYLLWEQRWLPRQCERDRVDLLHCPFNFGLPWFSPCPRVLTLHDAIDQVYYARRQSWMDTLRPAALQSRFYHWNARHRAEHIITVSEHAKRDLVRHLGLPPERVSVIYEAADPQFHEPIPQATRERVRQEHGLGRPYVFYIGGWDHARMCHSWYGRLQRPSCRGGPGIGRRPRGPAGRFAKLRGSSAWKVGFGC